MKEKVKKGLAYLLSSVLFVSTFATMLSQMALTVNAEGTQKAIQLVNSGNAANIEGAQKSNVYFGTYKQTKNGDGFNVDPIKWRVLSNSGGNLFLLSDRNLDVVQYHTVDEAVTWKESTIRSWLNGYDDSQNIRSFDYRDDNFIDTAFNASERSAISEVEVLNEKNPYYNTPWGDNTKDKVYLLSLSEATNTFYGFTDDYIESATREAKNTAFVASGGKIANPNMFKEGENDYWWLRTPGCDSVSIVVSNYEGLLIYDGGYAPLKDYAVRPAINLNLGSLIFTSAAEGGKISGTAGADALTAVADYNSNDWKVTLLDDGSTNSVGIGHQGFKAERIDYNAVSAGNAVSIKYSGAQTGTNEFVSAILADANDNILYYGNIAKCTNSSGEASINIKPGTPDGCKLYVFNEQCNGDKKTDYSSELIDLTAPKTKPVAKNIKLVTNGKADYILGGQKSNVYFGTYPQSSDGNGGYNVEPIKWRVLSNSNVQLFLLADQGLDCKEYNEIEYNETNKSYTWEGSSIRTWLNESTGGFFGDAFNAGEKKAIADTLVVNDDNPNFGTKGGVDTKDKIFLLSIAESEDTSFGFTGNDNSTDTRKVISTDYAKNNSAYVSSNGASEWWLRSPGHDDDYAASVNDDGGVSRYGDQVFYRGMAIRPALNLNLKSILFTSAAEGGKISGTAGADALTAVADYNSNDWKVTLLDDGSTNSVGIGHQGFKAERIDYNAVSAGNAVSIKYSGAQTGTNEFVSAILTDSNDNILYYGNIAKCTNSSGEASINIKPGTPDGCKLYVFNEQCNGDKKTDYSSELIDLTAPKTKPVAKNINLVVNGEADYIEGAQKSNVYFGTYPQSSDGEGGYKVEPIKWRVLSNSNGQLFMLANHGLDCKSYNETYTSITWEGSSIRTWLNETSGGFLHDAFVDIERGAIADTLVVNDDNPEHGTKGGNKTTDKIFLLSIAESEDTSFGFTGNDKSTDTRKVISTDYAKHNGAWVSGNGASDWWLRSPGYSPDNAALVLDTGNVFGTGYYVSTSKIAIRPALNLNLGSLIFTSAATGGKSSVVLGESEMEPIVNFGDGDIVEWKFTLHDTVSEGRDDLKINRIGSGDVANGGTVLFSYEDAVTGENEYLSVILVDENNNLLSYAKVADVSEEALGSAESFVRIPSTLTEGKKYKLRFLSEQCNGDYLTDYASEFAESRDIEFTVGKGTPTLDLLTISIPGLDKETWTIEYNGDKISVIVGVDDHVVGMGEPQVKYYDSEGIELENAPVDAGTYSFKIIIPEDKGYAAAELSSADWKFTIEKRTPTVDDFVVTNPKDTDYDGKGKTPSVDLIDDLSDIGKISVDYFKDGVAIEGEPKDAGEYTFKLNVDDSGKNFNSAENLSKDDWKFTIKKVNPKFTDISVSYPDSLTYDGNGKTVTPGPIEGKTGMGEITVNYYQGSDKLSEPPKKAGEYTFKLNIAGGNNFNGIENLTSDSWKFKIDKATPSTSDFKVDIPSDTTYDGNEKEVTITGLPEGIGEYSVTYYGSDEKPLTGKPKDNGKYKVKISFAEGDNFYGKDDLESDSWNFTIGKATPKASDFDVTVPDQDCTYDGNVKEASVKLNSSLDGMVTFEVVYYDDKDNKLESAPKEPGTYKVKINVAGGTNYEPVVLDNNWTFTIKTTDYEVVLELDDGTVLNNDVKTYTYGEGTKLPTAEDLKKDGHTFDGWYETKDFSGDKVTVISDKESGKKTYYAKWIINKYTVKFMNGDEVLESKEYEYGSMPSYDGAPSKDNVDNKTYYFTGWDPVITKVTGDATYTAQFGEDEIIYTITFEANGGSYDVISAITNSQFKLDTIPEPTLEGYKFLGWFTAVENGTKITTDTVFTADTTVYALWEEVTEPEEEEEEEPKKIPNYLDELFLKLNIAAELGGKQTVYWNVEDSLPYDVLHFLELHEDITLIFDYTYEDVDYSVTLGGKGFEADPKVPWAGPLYLYSVYKGKIIAKED